MDANSRCQVPLLKEDPDSLCPSRRAAERFRPVFRVGSQRMLRACDGAADRHARATAFAGREVDAHLLSIEAVPEHEQKRELDSGSVLQLAGSTLGEAKADG